MPKIPEFDNHNAATSFFHGEKFGDDSMWSLQAKTSAVVGGAPTYSVMGSNISANVADMEPYRTTSENVPLNTPVDSESFPYEFIGIDYVSNGATGNFDFYLKKKLDR